MATRRSGEFSQFGCLLCWISRVTMEIPRLDVLTSLVWMLFFLEAPAAKKKQPGEIRMQKVRSNVGWCIFFVGPNPCGHDQELDEMELPPQCHIEPPSQTAPFDYDSVHT